MHGVVTYEDSLSQMEVADDEKPQQRDAASRDQPPLRFAPFVLEWISRFEERVSDEIP
jgi:hypothetical protein